MGSDRLYIHTTKRDRPSQLPNVIASNTNPNPWPANLAWVAIAPTVCLHKIDRPLQPHHHQRDRPLSRVTKTVVDLTILVAA